MKGIVPRRTKLPAEADAHGILLLTLAAGNLYIALRAILPSLDPSGVSDRDGHGKIRLQKREITMLII